MLIRPMPKQWLIHDVTYRERLSGRDEYGNPKFAESVAISHVRVDVETIFSRDATDTKILANAVVFVDAVNSENVPTKFVEESIISFNGHDYVINKVIDCYYPTKNAIRHYEIEVI